MKISDETKEKLLLMLISGKEGNEQSPNLGKVCMIRTYSAGVHFGEVVSKHKQNVVLKNARRVWYWDGACSLSQLAMEGSGKISDCKIAMPVNEIELDQVIEVIPMTSDAIANLEGAKHWKA